MSELLQRSIRAIYPPQCVACDTMTEAEHGLCGPCWAQTGFISGAICDQCGAPLPGAAVVDGLQCDDCMRVARPWHRGRAAVVYSGVGRRLVLSLKHGDRLELSWPASGWMAASARALIDQQTVIVPVPLHWSRLLVRRYNQAALLAQDLGRRLNTPVIVDALQRVRATAALEKANRATRFETLSDAIKPHPKRSHRLAGRRVLLVDDVMTSGATLAACSDAASLAGAAQVDVVTLARVIKDA